MSAELHRLTAAGPVLEPPEDVLNLAQEMLDRARRGELKGLAVASVDMADSTSTNWASGCASGSLLLSAVTLLFGRVLIASAAREKDVPKGAA